MEFLKNHYEKVLLIVVLLGLVVALLMLPMKVSSTAMPVEPTTKKTFQPHDLSTNRAALAVLSNLPPLVLTGEHKVFNPAQWRKATDGVLRKFVRDDEIGPGALKMIGQTNKPLRLLLTLDNVLSTGFQVGFLQETNRQARSKVTRMISVGEKIPVGTLIRVEGPPENPELVFDLAEGGGPAIVAKGKPFIKIDGYATDLRYDFEAQGPKVFLDRRVGDPLVFDGETNNIVEIGSNFVVISTSSGNKHTITRHATP